MTYILAVSPSVPTPFHSAPVRCLEYSTAGEAPGGQKEGKEQWPRRCVDAPQLDMHANGWMLPCKGTHPFDARVPNFGARGDAGQNARHAAKVLARDMLYLCKTDSASGQRGTRPASRSEQAATDSAPFAVRQGTDALQGAAAAAAAAAAADASVERGPGASEQAQENAAVAMARLGGGASRAAAPRTFAFVKASKVFDFLMSGKKEFQSQHTHTHTHTHTHIHT